MTTHITVDWGDDDRTYLIAQMHTGWTCADYRVMRDQIVGTITHRGHTQAVDLIVDLSQSQSRVPLGIMTTIAADLSCYRHAPIERVFVISPNAIWKRVWETMCAIYQPPTCHIHFVDSTCALPPTCHCA